MATVAICNQALLKRRGCQAGKKTQLSGAKRRVQGLLEKDRALLMLSLFVLLFHCSFARETKGAVKKKLHQQPLAVGAIFFHRPLVNVGDPLSGSDLQNAWVPN